MRLSVVAIIKFTAYTKQFIGLTNDDPVSEEYRWIKQIIERLNRTLKFSYQATNGYSSDEGSNTQVSLFVANYNFLRPHLYTYWQPLNSFPELESVPNMPSKWQKLIVLYFVKTSSLLTFCYHSTWMSRAGFFARSSEQSGDP